MDRAQFEREKERGAAFAIASRLLHRGLITQDEYQKLTLVLTQKYRPVVSQARNTESDPAPRSNWTKNVGKEGKSEVS